MKEGDSIEEFNPWNREVKLLERVLNSHDLVMKEGKDDREVVSIGVTTKVEANKIKVSIRDSIKVNIEVSKASKAKVGASKGNQQQFEEIVDSNNNLKQRERGRSKK